MKVQAVAALKATYGLRLLLEIAGLARSTYFYHQAQRARPDPQADLKAAIRDAFAQAKGRYGHRRLRQQLMTQGWRVSRKTVLKLMRALGLVCVIRRRRYVSYRGTVGTIAPNVLNRNFTAAAPNQTWVTDVTEFRVGAQKVYLAPVMDLFDRQIIAYTVGPSPTLALTTTALTRALATLLPGEAPVVHSDQGFQYQHASWQQLLAEAGATPSMSRKGNCLDNAVMESFFGHLKEELFNHTRYADQEALVRAIHDYIAWYNTDRISTRLTGMSPVQYRVHARAA